MGFVAMLLLSSGSDLCFSTDALTKDLFAYQGRVICQKGDMNDDIAISLSLFLPPIYHNQNNVRQSAARYDDMRVHTKTDRMTGYRHTT